MVVHVILDRTHYVLATLKGDMLTDVFNPGSVPITTPWFNFNRLKSCLVTHLEGKPITHLEKLQAALNKDTRWDQAKPVVSNQVYCIIQSEEVHN